MIRKLVKFERKNSELDLTSVPMTSRSKILDWRYFNTDITSTDRQFDEVKAICDNNQDEYIDMRPYMIECPWTCSTTDKLQKVLDIYRHHQLR